MRMYTVHVRHPTLAPEVVLVREGFAWWAFLLTALWALWHRLWLAALALVAIDLALAAAAAWLALDAAVQAAASLAVAVVFGFVAGDLRRRRLERQGYAFAEVVGGEDRDAALRRFLDHAPELAREMPA